MVSAKTKNTLSLTLTLFWLLFTVTFAIWWFKFSLDHISALSELQPDRVDHWQRQKRMVVWEGSTWLVLLVLGGGALIALVQREKLRAQRIREFFASFSHEVKTSLASLRLQAESLKEDWQGKEVPVLDRLIGDTVRLQVQLENSLFFASQDNLQLYLQPLELSKIVERMQEQWPTLKIELKGDCKIRADDRALRTIVSNLLQNAIVHGRATRVVFNAKDAEADQIEIEIHDNGSGFDGDVENLGEAFHRPKTTSGSGLGLYICKLLMTKMNGRLVWTSGRDGFRAHLTLQGELQ